MELYAGLDFIQKIRGINGVFEGIGKESFEVRIPAKTATYSGNNFTTYTLIQFPC